MAIYTVSFQLKRKNGKWLKAADIHANSLTQITHNFEGVIWLMGVTSQEVTTPREVKWRKQNYGNVYRSSLFRIDLDETYIEYYFRKSK